MSERFHVGLKKLSHGDPWILGPMLILLALGTVMIYSASSPTGAERRLGSAYYLKHHLVHLSIGVGAMLMMFFVQARGLRKLALPGFLLSVALCLATLFTPAAAEANHATRWLSFGGFRFQPAELVKPLLIIYVAAYLAKRGDAIRQFSRGLLPLLLQVGVLLALIVKQPDFGTAFVLALVVFVMLFVGRTHLGHIGALGGTVVALGFLLIQTSGYRRVRIMTFLNPWNDPQGKGHQILQSLVAFDRGGIGGQGLGDGTQKLLYLPEAHTDFIFSVIAEELGIVGTLGVILCFAVLAFQGMRLAARIRDSFASYLTVGISALIGIQAFLNMAVVMALVPTKGLTLPLVSYGGSSLITTMMCLGILLSLSSSMTMAGAGAGANGRKG